MFGSSVKSAESSRKRNGMFPPETVPEVGCAAYMPGVYKMPMVRMSGRTDEPANVRVYKEIAQKYASPFRGARVVE